MAAIALLMVLMLPSTTIAADWSWSKEDVAHESVAAVITLIDYGQTQDIRNHNGMIELNPLLGKNPSRAAVRNYFIGAMLLHPVVTAILPKEVDVLGINMKPRLAWQYFYLGIEATTTLSNLNGGLKLSF